MDNEELYALLKTDISELEKGVRATNGRVQQLEIWRAWTSGALKMLGVVSAVPSIILTIVLIAQST